MKDTLKDLIEHTSALGSIDLVKISGTDKETNINAVAEDKSVILIASLKNPHPDFMGVFGMPNLSKLKTIIGFEEYDENAKIFMVYKDRDGNQIPDTIHFETKNGDFINDYRLMAKAVVEDKIKNVKFHGTVWNVEFEPTVAGIQRLRKQQSANSEESTFTTRVENGDLKIYFGDPSTHSGNFVFHTDIKGTLNNKWHWPVKQVVDILNLPGDKTMKISDQGAAEITVDSGLAVYQYLLPAQTK